MNEFTGDLEKLYEQHAIEWLGYVDRLDMPVLYGSCKLFVYPSYFEGYGMPVAEAMACGAPVACGDRTSLPEVGGDAPLYFDPFDEDAIANAIKEALGDSEKLQALHDKSLAQAKTFLSWDEVAARYLEILKPWLKG